MTIYIVLWISIIICCFIEVNFDVIKFNRLRIKTRRISFLYLYLFILLIGVLRKEIFGVDVNGYRNRFFYDGNRGFLEILKSKDVDIGFSLINKVIYLFTDDFWLFRAIIYFITFTLFSYVIYKKSKYISVSYLCYIGFGFLGYNFCIIRQAIAISICFVAFRFAKEKRPIKFIFYVFLACIFHQTAIFYILVYFISNDVFKDKFGFKKMAFVILAILAGNYILPFLYQFNKNDYSTIVVSGTGYNMLVFYIIIIGGIGYLLTKIKDNDLKEEYETLCIAIYFQIDAIFFSLISRIVFYFNILLTIIVPNILYKYKKKNWLLFITIIICTFMYYLSLGERGGTEIVPYLSIFDQ